MKTKIRRNAFSLVEMLVVIAIISLLIGAVVKVAGFVRTNAQVKATENSIHLLCTALEAHREYQKESNEPFPISPYGYWLGSSGEPGEANHIKDFLTDNPPVPASNSDVINNDHTIGAGGSKGIPGDESNVNCYREANVSSEVLYLVLDQTAASQTVLRKLPGNAVANLDKDEIDLDSDSQKDRQFNEVIDAWKQPLRYRTLSNTQMDNFPVITSAGPDGIFDTADDIISTEL